MRCFPLLFLLATSGGVVSTVSAPVRATVVESSVAVAHRAGGTSTSFDDRGKSVLYRTGFPGAEPTLAIARDGTVFTVSWEPGAQVDVLRSSDEGVSWDRISPRLPGGENSHRLSFDPYVYLDDDGGRLFTVDLLIACSYLSYSDDHGDSWTTNPLACGQPFNDHQSIFSGPPVSSTVVGYEEIVYYCFADYTNNGAFCSKSLDGGITFLPAGEKAYPAYEDEKFCGGAHGHGVVDEDGVVYLPADFCGRPFLAISDDEGASWRRIRVAPIGHVKGPDPAVAVDDLGNIYYTWIGPDRLPRLVVSRDGGDRWTKPLLIAAPGVKEAAHVTIAAGAPGRIAFGYMGSENSRFSRCAGENRCRPSYAGVMWHGYIGMTANAWSRNPRFFSGIVNRKSEPLIEGSCGPRRCDWLLDFMDVVVGPDGTPWGTFVDTVTKKDPDYHEAVIGRLIGGPPLR